MSIFGSPLGAAGPAGMPTPPASRDSNYIPPGYIMLGPPDLRSGVPEGAVRVNGVWFAHPDQLAARRAQDMEPPAGFVFMPGNPRTDTPPPGAVVWNNKFIMREDKYQEYLARMSAEEGIVEVQEEAPAIPKSLVIAGVVGVVGIAAYFIIKGKK